MYIVDSCCQKWSLDYEFRAVKIFARQKKSVDVDGKVNSVETCYLNVTLSLE